MISKGEGLIRKMLPKTKRGELLGGVLLVIFVAAVSTAVPFAILWAAGKSISCCGSAWSVDVLSDPCSEVAETEA